MTTDILALAKRAGTPVIAGNQVTFVWQSKREPHLMGDFNAWAGDVQRAHLQPLNLVQSAPGVWTFTLELPRNAYVEYSFLTGKGRTLDPLNARTTPNGIGGINNFFYMPDAAPTPYAEKRRGIARGRMATHVLNVPGMVVGNTRKIYLYEPPVRGAVPLLVAFDGQDYLKRVQLPVLLDNLIADKKIPPVAVAMVESASLGKGSARMAEYAMSELTLLFVLKQVLPLAQKNLKLLAWKQNPGAYAVMGASMGGLMSLFTAMRAPHVFGTAISHAGAFELYASRPFIFDLAALVPKKTTRVWLDVGRMDWLLQPNRRMRKWLKENGYPFEYREYYAYHNWPAWRNVLPEALTWALGS